MPRAKPPDLETLRRGLRDTLPKRIAQAIKSYDAFATTPPPDDPKGFGAHHAACRACLAHAETLVKLARWAEGTEAVAESDPNDIERLIAEARSAIEDMDDDL
ncbi:MAG: hypothetical protein HQL33_01585 [Alphaproteobacteria bacterium]|nr:hypothetical protein [Alphaproteobacteria bacterium]MBF0128661.1 hypothetical protein [Alphaproteobacteria bacterium]